MIILTEEAKKKGIARLVEEHGVQFFDFGCSNGGSIEHVNTKYDRDSKGMGFDISQTKLEEASSRDHLVSNFDILSLPEQPMVGYTTMFHILEHIDSQATVSGFIQKACAVSRDFVFIIQPFFDADAFLFAHGLKLFWSDWGGHPNRMTTLEMYLILNALYRDKKIEGFKIFGKGLICDSSYAQILPLNTLFDQQDYDPDEHPPKRTDLVFDFPVFKELAVLIEVRKGSGEEFVVSYGPDEVLYSSD